MATNYFNNTEFFNAEMNDPLTMQYGGLNSTGYVFNTSVCLFQDEPYELCTITNQEVLSISQINEDHWNVYSPLSAGIFGLGWSSPVWSIINDPASKIFDIQLTNFTDWTWADSSYVNVSVSNEINFGDYGDYTYDSDTPKTQFSPAYSGSYLFSFSEFGFGKTDSSNSSEFYESLLNDFSATIYDDEDYLFWSNTSSIAMNFRGLGLPRDQYLTFSNLLALAADGKASCVNRQGGFCALSGPCEDFTDSGIWDYHFKIRFNQSNDDNYIRVPLASFAANREDLNGQCAIYVEMLAIKNSDSRQIILGSMFFQSFYAQYSMFGYNGVLVTLMKNENALAMTYLGDTNLTTGEDPFSISPVTMTAALENQGLPIFNVTMTGITDTFPYFFLDFSNDKTVVWDVNCIQNGINVY